MIIIISCLIIVLIIVIVIALRKNKIPQTIYTYWNDENVPELVQKCIKSWRKYNPNYKIIIINRLNYKQHCDIDDLTKLKHNDSFARESDFIRLATLSKNGGIWMDATIVCMAPLPKTKQFFGYYLEGFTKMPHFPVIESWFFACSQNCEFVKAWKEEFFSINDYDTIDNYITAVKQKNIFIDGIEGADYLCIHVAAQKVLQENPNFKKNMTLLKAEDGPYKYLSENKWNIKDSFDWLCAFNTYNYPILKLRSLERKFIQDNPQYQSCLFYD